MLFEKSVTWSISWLDGWVLFNGAFTAGARLHATEIRTIDKMFHVSQQNHSMARNGGHT